MATVYLGLGSNIGNKRRNLITASALLAERAGDIPALSAIYETEPWGFESENSFMNSALILETELFPEALLEVITQIEKELGRVEKSVKQQYKDRVIDIDILFYDNDVIDTQSLTIPHPLIARRSFVLEPLMEIAPFLKHPVLNKTILELYNEL
jgi:2-amino-4-hydroxy-6-hydroxymethyldihydropteridine pyrophosphokinase